MKKGYFVLTIAFLVYFVSFYSIKAQLIIYEEFNNGTTPPDGWIFSGITGVYTTAGNYGKNPPSLRFDNTDDYIITPLFNMPPDSLSFWIKRQSADDQSMLIIEQKIGTLWDTLGTIKPLPTVGKIYKYKLDSKTTQLRFSYYKSSGNLAFDDVIVTETKQPYIKINKDSLKFKETPLDSLSDPLSYKLIGKNLLGPLTIATNNPQFKISLNPIGGFSDDITLMPNQNGQIDTTLIYVKFSPQTVGQVEGKINHISNGADSIFLFVSGLGFYLKPEPLEYPLNFQATGISENSIILTWTEPIDSNVEGYVIFIGQNLDDIPQPNDGIVYSSSNARYVSKGINQLLWDNLLPNTIYYFKIFPYSNSDKYINYKSDNHAPYDSAKTKRIINIVPIIPKRTDVSGFITWIDNDITGTTYLQLLKSTSYTITPPMNFYDFDIKKIKFKARTYGTYEPQRHIVRVSISTNNGKTWILLGERFPQDNTLREVEEFDVSQYKSIYARIKFETPFAGSNKGAGIDDIEILGAEAEVRNRPDSYPINVRQNPKLSDENRIYISWQNPNAQNQSEGYFIIISKHQDSIIAPLDGMHPKDSIGFSYVVEAQEEATILSGLSPNQDYYLAIYPFANWKEKIKYLTANFPIYNFSTLAPLPTANAINFKIDSLNYGYIRLTWDNNDQVQDLPDGYLLIGCIDSSYIDSITNLIKLPDDYDLSDGKASIYFSNNEDFVAEFRSLNPYTKYYFYLISYNGPKFRYKIDASIPLIKSYANPLTSMENEKGNVIKRTIEDFKLYQNYPNPFNSTTQIKVAIPKKSYVELKIYNVLGVEILNVFNGELEAGEKEFTVDLNGYSGGIYIYQLKSPYKTLSSKMILLK